MLAIGCLLDYEIFQFNKRAYTDKYPGIAIPSTMSRPAIKNVITHLEKVLSDKDKEADKFDGRKAEYDEKVNVS